MSYIPFSSSKDVLQIKIEPLLNSGGTFFILLTFAKLSYLLMHASGTLVASLYFWIVSLSLIKSEECFFKMRLFLVWLADDLVVPRDVGNKILRNQGLCV